MAHICDFVYEGKYVCDTVNFSQDAVYKWFEKHGGTTARPNLVILKA